MGNGSMPVLKKNNNSHMLLKRLHGVIYWGNLEGGLKKDENPAHAPPPQCGVSPALSLLSTLSLGPLKALETLPL